MKSTRSLALGGLLLLCPLLAGGVFDSAAAQAKPEGEMRWAMYVTLSPVWFDPGESVIGVLTPFWILYAMHDALVKPMPGNAMATSLAESWTVSSGVICCAAGLFLCRNVFLLSEIFAKPMKCTCVIR